MSTETGARTIIGEYSGVAGIQSITHILADSNNSSLYVLDSASGTILKVSATSGLASVVHGESAQVEGLHWAPVDWTLKAESGTLILRTEEPATLIEFDPITGQGVVIAR